MTFGLIAMNQSGQRTVAVGLNGGSRDQHVLDLNSAAVLFSCERKKLECVRSGCFAARKERDLILTRGLQNFGSAKQGVGEVRTRQMPGILLQFLAAMVNPRKSLRLRANSLLLVSLTLFASQISGAPATLQEKVTETKKNLAAASWPKDGRFLSDQIDLIAAFPAGTGFDISTRPGQFLFISLPVEGKIDLIRQFGFIIMPEVNGVMAVDYSALEGVENSELTFTVHPFCIEDASGDLSRSEPQGVILDSKGILGCRYRNKFSRSGDNVITSRPIRGIEFNEPVAVHGDGVILQIKGYRRNSSSADSGNAGPLAKCCVETESAEVCACKVINGNSRCQVGCN